MTLTIKNLAFEGGGVKGVAYGGALQVLEEKGVLQQVERVAGTSAGAITSVLVSLRYSAADITTTVKNMDLGSFDDKEGLIKKLHFYGLHPGDTFLTWIKKQIVNSGHGFNENATFQDFKAAGCRDLRVFASDVYAHRLQEFSFEKTPTAIVAEAARASMSIPLYFNAWKFTNNIPNDHLYVDGGLIYNYPIDAFDEGGVNPNSLGFRLKDIHDKATPNEFGYGHLIKYVKNTFETLLHGQNIAFSKDVSDVKRSVIIDDLGVKATDFDITNATKEKLLESGKEATTAYLAKMATS